MRREFVFAFIIGFVFVFGSAYAAGSLVVEKVADPPSVVSGGTVNILLNISNPFDSDIAVMIQDYNSVGGMTKDTKCVMGTIAARASGLSAYDSLQAYNPGDFELGTLYVKYTNPETGEEEIYSSKNHVVVTVTGGSANMMYSGNSVVENCDFGENEEAESQQQQQQSQQEQDESSQNEQEQQAQQAAEEAERERMQQEMQDLRENQDEMQKKLSQSRQNTGQDMNAVKQQQQSEAQAANEQTNQELSDALSNDDDFQKMDEELREQGYEQKDISRSALQDNETDFSATYEKPDGSQAQVQGSMKDGEIEDLKKFSSEDQNALSDALASDDDFKAADERLREQGFEPESMDYSGMDSSNSTSFDYKYTRPDGEIASVTGSVSSGEVSDIGSKSSVDEKNVMDALDSNKDFNELDSKLKSSGFSQDGFELSPFVKNLSEFSVSYSSPDGEQVNITGSVEIKDGVIVIKDIGLDDGITIYDDIRYVLILGLIVIGAYSYYMYSLAGRCGPVGLGPGGLVDIVDARADALEILSVAEKEYKSGKRRKAYTTVSRGLRVFFKYAVSPEKEELTTREILDYARQAKSASYVDDVRECSRICDLVKFAKYRPNDDDFFAALGLAKKCLQN